MEYDAEIYMLVNRALPGKTQFSDITIFKDETGYWCIGEDPACFERWVAMYAPGQKPYTRILHNAGIKFMSQVIYMRQSGTWTCVKNRFGSNSSARPPFTSLNEARIISAVNGWPDPTRIAARASTLYYMLNGT